MPSAGYCSNESRHEDRLQFAARVVSHNKTQLRILSTRVGRCSLDFFWVKSFFAAFAMLSN